MKRSTRIILGLSILLFALGYSIVLVTIIRFPNSLQEQSFAVGLFAALFVGLVPFVGIWLLYGIVNFILILPLRILKNRKHSIALGNRSLILK